jgi:hypothetical protein
MIEHLNTSFGTLISRSRFAPCVRQAVILLCFLIRVSFADEWKPRHDLVSHTGVMNLTEPPPPSEVFFPGPASPLDQPNWLDGLKAWRNERRTLLRYGGSPGRGRSGERTA